MNQGRCDVCWLLWLMMVVTVCCSHLATAQKGGGNSCGGDTVVKEVSYDVSYNRSDGKAPDEDCSKHYASTALSHMLWTESFLIKTCAARSKCSSVWINPQANAKISTNMVIVSLFMKVSSNKTGNAEMMVDDCVNQITELLQDIRTFDMTIAAQPGMQRENKSLSWLPAPPNATHGDCPSAVISENHMVRNKCIPPLVFNEDTQLCEKRADGPTESTTATTTEHVYPTTTSATTTMRTTTAAAVATTSTTVETTVIETTTDMLTTTIASTAPAEMTTQIETSSLETTTVPQDTTLTTEQTTFSANLDKSSSATNSFESTLSWNSDSTVSDSTFSTITSTQSEDNLDTSTVSSSSSSSPETSTSSSFVLISSSALLAATDTLDTTSVEPLSTLAPTEPSTSFSSEAVLTTKQVTSAPHYPWGIKMVTNVAGGLTVKEGGLDLNITFTAWANRSAICADNPDACPIMVRVGFLHNETSVPKCRASGRPISQLVLERGTWRCDGAAVSKVCTTELGVGASSEQRMQTYSLILRARLDASYDDDQNVTVVLGLKRSNQNMEENFTRFQVKVVNADEKATCQSINDPHITTFDGLEYNNFYHGEFVFYKHTRLPFSVHTVYQRCSPEVDASCNCAVAVQTGDDVIVFDRCYRLQKPFKRYKGEVRRLNPYRVTLYLRGNLTQSTRVFQEGDGKKYHVRLPNGVIVKVMTSNDLVNVWVMASPSDKDSTRGLCGTYTGDTSDDFLLRNGNTETVEKDPVEDRPSPHNFVIDWRVEIGSSESLLQGMPEGEGTYELKQYCDSWEGECDYGLDLRPCDVIFGTDVTDVTEQLISAAVRLSDEAPVPGDETAGSGQTRRRRAVGDNSLTAEPIVIKHNFVPPKYKWDSEENEVKYDKYCRDHIMHGDIGMLCQKVTGINFEQEITTCKEDIKITKNTTWADSALEAMKEQCAEAIMRNDSVPSDITNQIQGKLCTNECSRRGECIDGTCRCNAGYTSVDCSVSEGAPPYIADMPNYGLCDLQYMKCDTVMVYGEDFVRSDKLTCHFQQCEVGTDPSQMRPLNVFTRSLGLFINFNTVECPLPAVNTYLVSVSNNGDPANASDPLLFIPFDSVCNECSTNETTCVRKKNSCLIDGKCYRKGDASPNDACLICDSFADSLEWTTSNVTSCQPWYAQLKIPEWLVAVLAALGGSIVGVVIGFLLYKCCCRKRFSATHQDSFDSQMEPDDPQEFTQLPNRARLHRDPRPPEFTTGRYPPLTNPVESTVNYDESYFYNDGRGVDNGIDSSTYF